LAVAEFWEYRELSLDAARHALEILVGQAYPTGWPAVAGFIYALTDHLTVGTFWQETLLFLLIRKI